MSQRRTLCASEHLIRFIKKNLKIKRNLKENKNEIKRNVEETDKMLRKPKQSIQ